MTKKELEQMLREVQSGSRSVEQALEQMQEMPYKDLEYAKVDYHRELRNGFPEVIYSPGKSLEQIRGIMTDMLKRTKGNILASRADEKVYETIRELTEDAVYYKEARAVVVKRQDYRETDSYIAVVTAGTSDIPVAEEAAVPTLAEPVEAALRAPGLGTVTVTLRTSVPPSPTLSVAAISVMEP